MIMIEFLNYSQGRDKMVKNFKFFHGAIRSTLTATWSVQEHEHYGIDVEAELTRMMSEEIARGIDEEIINRLTRRINGGDNLDYFDRWMNIGGNRA
jgi:hypothetical protein